MEPLSTSEISAIAKFVKDRGLEFPVTLLLEIQYPLQTLLKHTALMIDPIIPWDNNRYQLIKRLLLSRENCQRLATAIGEG